MNLGWHTFNRTQTAFVGMIAASDHRRFDCSPGFNPKRDGGKTRCLFSHFQPAQVGDFMLFCHHLSRTSPRRDLTGGNEQYQSKFGQDTSCVSGHDVRAALQAVVAWLFGAENNARTGSSEVVHQRFSELQTSVKALMPSSLEHCRVFHPKWAHAT